MRTLTDADADHHAAEIEEQGDTVVDDAFGQAVLDRDDADDTIVWDAG